jgi:hypothetical protein
MADHPNEDRDSSDPVMTASDVQSGSDIVSKMTVADVQSGSATDFESEMTVAAGQSGSVTDDKDSKSKLKDAIQAG